MAKKRQTDFGDFQEEQPASTDFGDFQPEPARGLIGQVREAGGVMPYAKEVGRQAAAIPLGAAQEVGRMFGPEAAKLGIGGLAGGLIPGQVPQPAAGTEAPARTGRALADIGVYTGATALGGGVGEAAAIPGWIGRTIGATGAGYSIAGKPGAAMGLLGQPLAEAVAPIARGIGKLATRISPNRYAKEILKRIPKLRSGEDILSELSEGKNLPENSQSTARKIRKSYLGKSDESTENFDLVKGKAGKRSIYEKITKPVPQDSYAWLTTSEESPIDKYRGSLKNAHSEFSAKPNYENAHKLQSVLGHEGMGILKSPLSNYEERSVGKQFMSAQQHLRNDIYRHLDSVDPTRSLSSQYKSAINYHKLHVIPYETNKYIRDIAKGKVTNPGNITTIFKNPEEDVRKVVGDLGPQFKNQIISHDLQKTMRGRPTEEKLTKAFDTLGGKGLDEYISPRLDKQIDSLRHKEAVNELVKGIGKKPTAKNLLKGLKRVETKKLYKQLPFSLQDQLESLRTRVRTRGYIKKGAVVGGLSGIGIGGWKLRHLL